MRIGYGFDIHSFGSIKPLVIGGVTIPYKKGLIAYSNGDLLIHALIDALLGAVAIGDIGTFFPSDNILYKDIDSRVLLKNVWSKIQLMQYVICNIDITIIAESPKMSSYISYMKTNLGSDLNTQENKISIKSTTAKQISAIGRKEGIACQAVVMLLKKVINNCSIT